MATVVLGDFEWDATKATSNVAKHGVRFEDAVDALNDENAVEFDDLLVPMNTVTIGMDRRARVLLVVSTERGERTRIISARKATRIRRSRGLNIGGRFAGGFPRGAANVLMIHHLTVGK